MTFKDVMSLAMSGYKPNEIAEMMKLEKETTFDAVETNAEEVTETEVKAEENVADTVTDTATVDGLEQSTETDYKELYEQTLDTLKAVQSANINRDNSVTDNRSLEDIAVDIFRRI